MSYVHKQNIENHFKESIQTKLDTLETLSGAIANAGLKMVECIKAGNKILSCGNGGSSGDAMHFSSELINRYERERPPLPAIALTADNFAITAIGNDYSYAEIFSKQIEGLGKEGDILLAFSTSGNSENVIRAIHTAHKKNMRVIALTGKDGGKISPILKETDLDICIPAKKTSRIQESHLVVIHALCDLIDNEMFPNA